MSYCSSKIVGYLSMYTHRNICIFGCAILKVDTDVNFRSLNRTEQKVT